MTKTWYTQDHEWLRVENGVATIGITDHAQEQLGDLVFVELPEVGRTLDKGESAAVVESVKAASDVYSPVSGEVVAVNGEVTGDPALVNREAETGGWLMQVRLSDATQIDGLMDEAAYKAFAG
jgi:glycine cleavage system H protein